MKNNQFVKGILTGEISEKQVVTISKICKSLGQEVPENVSNWSKQQASVYIDRFLQKSIDEGRKFASEHQVQLIKDMLQYAYIKECFKEEIEVIPNDWMLKIEQLKDEIKTFNKILINGIVEKEYIVKDMNDIEEIADLLVNNQLISEEDYNMLIWEKLDRQQAVLFEIEEKYNLTIKDNTIRQMKKVSKSYIEKEIEKRQSRIIKFNDLYKERETDKLSNLLEVEASHFIDNHMSEYREWKNNRLTTGQFNYIKKLDRTIDSEAINLLSKKQATQLINKMVFEQSLLEKRSEEEERTNRIEEAHKKGYGFSKLELMSMDEKRRPSEWSKLVTTIESVIGYETGLRDDIDNYTDLLDVCIFAKSLVEITDIETILSDFILPTDFIQALNNKGINPTTPRTADTKLLIDDTLNNIEQLIKGGYINKEDILKMFN